MSTQTTLKRVKNVLATYIDRVSSFHPNARLYLVSVILTGAALGVFRLLFNFYILSQEYNEAFLGTLITTSSLAALLAALPMGYLVDRIGRKQALILGGLGITLAVFGMILFPSTPIFILMSVLLGLTQSLSGVAMGPFLMENSDEKERTYLFSFSAGLQMASAFFGNWIGGYLPTWMASWLGGSATSPSAYAWSLGAIALAGILGVVPLFMLRSSRTTVEGRSVFAPLAYFTKNARQLSRLILPILVTSLGAGLVMPFINVFYRNVHSQPDPVIGALFAWGSLAMGVGLLIAPPLAERYGKIQMVVLTQAFSIPFLIMMGFAPWFSISALAYYVRLTLMNMSLPIYQTFVMERVDPSSRATVASLASMAGNVGWAFSPQISGWIQVHYGFSPAFGATLILYVISIYLYWRFFWFRERPKKKVAEEQLGATFNPRMHLKK